MDERTLAENTAKELLEKLGFSNATIATTEDEEKRLNIQIDVEPEDSGMLIGFHGETLQAMQLILSQMIYKQAGQWRTITVNIGDYRQKRQLALESMAANAAQRVKLTGLSLTLPYLSSYERRLIHLAISQDPGLETFSQGEGKDRRLVIAPKKDMVKEEQPESENNSKPNA
ncbi:MAG: hypothetical protein A3F04_00840 [Candidatus Chisholmbacteria bacterium RIFCSPHIGHO2_12_FULL_49_9]|uniref:R3H domain-containing protein n=1 Tax=Candidatus Chisholmbacteria bacterium RIFCSPHIGHO2_01_FULL_52_32 TaxID=1797591 RepID=A0A1G1VUN7_9BACT|nr:MAG: hypothetical protein A2786_06050 [Candidatus Chisholmbacteria bacterium RIFCSPHIGHO2_01_FULL_52_32]OGY19418.1 MAG: hypothetical protein A3F04_00840 [Candidatus Chisholmbacteria bacterium RIFCSPHIGHO2_12_FULL_49_9]OGY19665.1 MAG: hypothetical protein A2900_00990 [Candidatus Chisholmbacteria bacterium RIFCSPLOWO2_01_FULL_50_28]